MDSNARRARNGLPPSGDAGAPADLSGIFQQGVQLHQAGQLAEAEALYRRVLDRVPDQPDAMHLLGVVRHQGGDHAGAVELIRRSIQINPRNADAHSNLGAALSAAGEAAAAEDCFRQAIRLNPGHLTSHANLAGLAARRGADREAIESFRTAHTLKPEEPRFMKRLAELYLKHEQFGDAADWYARYFAFVADDAEAHNNAGWAYQKLKRPEEAERHYRKAAGLRPDNPEIGNNLATVLRILGRTEEADRLYADILETDPSQWEDVSHYAGALFNNGRLKKALALYEALALERPQDAALHREYGTALMTAGQLEEAEDVYRRAIRLDPSQDRVRIEFAHCLLHSRRIDEAMEELSKISPDSPHYLGVCLDLACLYSGADRHEEACDVARRAVAHPDYRPSMFVKPYSVFRATCAFDDIETLPFSLADIEDHDLGGWAGIFLELLVLADTPELIRDLTDLHRRWGEKFLVTAAADALPEIDLAARSGRIRLGFLSSDLRAHSVARFVLPLLENYDRERFEIYCYVPEEDLFDQIQNRIRGLVTEFRVIGPLGHRAAAKVIREDEIDILFELNGFTAKSRLPVLAYRPAPVQIYWLGYPFTSGLPSIDYILLDDRVAPPAGTDFLVEKPLLMPGSWVCYDPFETATPAEDLPAARNGLVTFGTLNNPYKFTRAAIALWCDVLRQVPGSRYLLVHPEYKSAVVTENLAREFERNGIGRDRLRFVNNREGHESHFGYYNEIDITLDSFPLTGGTSTCDALWMGVPVISRSGPGIHQRLSYSLLGNAGLPELCMETDAAIVEKAVALARDLDRLGQLRRDLRGMVRNSPLGRPADFGRDFCTLMDDVVARHGLRGDVPGEPASETHPASTLDIPLLHLP